MIVNARRRSMGLGAVAGVLLVSIASALGADKASCKPSSSCEIGPLVVAGSSYTVQFDSSTDKKEHQSLCRVIVRKADGSIAWRRSFAQSVSMRTANSMGTAYSLEDNSGAQAIALEFAWSSPGRVNSGWFTLLYPKNGRLISAGRDVHFYGRMEHIPDKGPNARKLVSGDFTRYQIWTGHYYLIAGVRADLRSGTISRLCSKNCTMAVICSPALPPEAQARVVLYERPGFGRREVAVGRESKLECLDAFVGKLDALESPRSKKKLWLHVRVDGTEGWIQDSADLERLGLARVERASTPDSN